jgi:hypothetical protein
MHIKPDSKNVTIAEIKKILDKTFNFNIILSVSHRRQEDH